MIVRSVIQQAGGKLVVAGYGRIGSKDDFALVRYNDDGSLDVSFDGDGKVTTDISGNSDQASSVIQQADGKLVVSGNALEDVALVRYNEDGSLDTGFGSAGKVTTAIGAGNAYGRSVIQRVDGRLMVAGSSTNGSNWDFTLVCYESGQPDTDNDGVADDSDNCPLVSNLNQLDWDSDGAGDKCDDPVPTPDDVEGDLSKEKVGSSVAFAGDFNGDGYGDYAIGAPDYDIPAAPPAKAIKDVGKVEVISGKNGVVLFTSKGVIAKDGLGFAVTGGRDINNDGFDDVVIGAPLADTPAAPPAKAIKDTGFGACGLRLCWCGLRYHAGCLRYGC
ncbi:MAG: thrombospondin type 3 repeat-containing protein [Pseudomonadales bacterium]